MVAFEEYRQEGNQPYRFMRSSRRYTTKLSQLVRHRGKHYCNFLDKDSLYHAAGADRSNIHVADCIRTHPQGPAGAPSSTLNKSG